MENEKEVKEVKPKTGANLSPVAGTADNPILSWFIGLGAAVFFVAVILWTASLTMSVMEIVLPHNPTVKYFALALFDGGALVWLGMFTNKAKGTPQRGISLLLFGLDFLGVVLMTAGGVYLGGQTLTAIPAWMGAALVNGVIAATLANVGGAYYFHANNPETRETMQAQSLEDTLTEEAMRQAKTNVQREARQLGSIMARRATARIKYRLALPMSENERAEWEGETVNGEVIEPAQLPAPADDVPVWVKSFFGLFGRGRNSDLLSKSPGQSEPIITSTSNASNSNEEQV